MGEWLAISSGGASKGRKVSTKKETRVTTDSYFWVKLPKYSLLLDFHRTNQQFSTMPIYLSDISKVPTSLCGLSKSQVVLMCL